MHFVCITQVYPPDAAAVGQHFEDAALALAARGHRITVYTADRDYDDPSIRYDGTSRNPKVRVVRLPFSSFGKKTILHRLVGQGSFLLQVMARLLIGRGVDGVILTTIPATTGVFFTMLRLFRRLPYLYWVMDVNPDQAIALGAVSPKHPAARFIARCNRRLVRDARRVVCLDDEMVRRVTDATESNAGNTPIAVIPPWPLESDLETVSEDANPFVEAHALFGCFVFMYSGNHSLVHPLSTMLEGIELAELDPGVRFAFVGGGRGKQAVDALIERCESMPSLKEKLLSLPYQPLDQIKYSLSAADVQVVVHGDAMIGIVHPCKLYTAMALAKPILFIGPGDSALGRIVQDNEIGWCVAHGDLEKMRRLLETIPGLPPKELEAMGQRALKLTQTSYSREKLCGEFCHLAEAAFASEQGAAG